MPTLKKEEIIDAISNMSLKEVSELVKLMEEKFGVSAAAPVAIAAMPNQAGAAAPDAEEKSEFDVILKDFDKNNKIPIIKAVRVITGLGLKEAKALVEAGGKVLKEGVPKAEAQKIKEQCEAAGGVVEIK